MAVLLVGGLGFLVGCKPRTFNQVKSDGAAGNSTGAELAAQQGEPCTPAGKETGVLNGALSLIQNRSIYFTNHKGGEKITEKTSKGVSVVTNASNAGLWQREVFLVTKLGCSEALKEAFLGPVFVRRQAYDLGNNRLLVFLAARGVRPSGEPVKPWAQADNAKWATSVKVEGKEAALTTRAVAAVASLQPGGRLLLESVPMFGDKPTVFQRYFRTDEVEMVAPQNVSSVAASKGTEADRAIAESYSEASSKGQTVDLVAAVRASREAARATSSSAPGTLVFSDARRETFHKKAFEFVRSYAPTPGVVGTTSHHGALFFHRAGSVDSTREGAVFKGKDAWLVSTQPLNTNGGGSLFVLAEGYNVNGVTRPAFVDLVSGTDEAPGAFEVELFAVGSATLDASGVLKVEKVNTQTRWQLKIPGGGAHSEVSLLTQPALFSRD